MTFPLKKRSKAAACIIIAGVFVVQLIAPATSPAKTNFPNIENSSNPIRDFQNVHDSHSTKFKETHLAVNSDQKWPSRHVKGDALTAVLAEVNDPLEPVNRVIFELNDILNRIILQPIAELYLLILPDAGQKAVHNFLRNLGSPVVLSNDLLQGEMGRAWITMKRMVINTTVGLGGVVDVADNWGIKSHSEDLGQTFAVWGVPEGFYLVLPVLGPSNPRDAVGKFLGFYLDPVSRWLGNTNRDEWSTARNLIGGVDEFSGVMDNLQKLEETSIDLSLIHISEPTRPERIGGGGGGG